MSAILKAGQPSTGAAAPSVFHMPDLMREAQRVVDVARRRAARIMEETRQQAVQLREQARQRGYEHGLHEGHQEGQQRGRKEALANAQERFHSDLQHLAENLANTIRELNVQRQDRLRSAEHDLLEFAVEIARRVTKTVGRMSGEVAPANLRSALSMVVAQSDLTVRVHPDDLAALQRFADTLAHEAAAQPHLKFITDSSISRGGVLIVSPDGELDATLEQQMDHIADALTAGGRSDEHRV